MLGMVDLQRSMQSESHRSSCTAITVDGTPQRSELPSTNLPVSQVSHVNLLPYPALKPFELPTAQLQKFEDSAPESLEFERLKEHFEPYLRASPSTAAAPHSHHTHTNPITAAASSALARDIPGVAKYTPHSGPSGRRTGRDKGNRHEIPDYRARGEVGSTGFTMGGGGETDVEFIRHLESASEVATLEQRWMNSWTTSMRSE